MLNSRAPDRALAGIASTIAGNSFIGGGSPGALAANYAQIQLWNPAASGKILYVQRALIYQSASGDVQLRSFATALTGVAGQASKDLGGAAGVGQVRFQLNGAILGTFMAQHRVLQDQDVEMIQHDAIRVPEGNGLDLVGAQLASTATGFFEWRELPS